MTEPIDLSPLPPRSRPVVERAAHVYLAHTRPWFVGLLLHGSALKGGFIPGGSDVDFQLYLRDDLFDRSGNIPLPLAVAIARDLGAIDPAPFQYIQCYPLSSAGRPHGEGEWLGPIPGAYYMLAGRLPIPESTPAQLLEAANRRLASLDPARLTGANGLLERGGGRLERHIRLLCTDVWPALYSILTLLSDDPLASWKRPKDEAVGQLPEDLAAGKAIRSFHRAAVAYYGGDGSLDEAIRVVEAGGHFLQAAREWYARWAGHER